MCIQCILHIHKHISTEVLDFFYKKRFFPSSYSFFSFYLIRIYSLSFRVETSHTTRNNVAFHHQSQAHYDTCHEITLVVN